MGIRNFSDNGTCIWWVICGSANFYGMSGKALTNFCGSKFTDYNCGAASPMMNRWCNLYMISISIA